MLLKKQSFKILFLLIILLLSTGFRCTCVSGNIKKQLKPITIEYWGVEDDSKNLDDLIKAYHSIHPNITINYRKFRYEEYERRLLEGWADANGPDIYAINSKWILKYKNKIAPMPAKITMPYVYYEPPLPGCSKKTEERIEMKTSSTLSLNDIKNKYVQVVYNDIVMFGTDNKPHIYALPFSLDTIALFYNRDLLDSANIAFPPADWDEFIEDTRLLTRYDAEHNIVQAGAALGEFENVNHAFDIISLLFLQNGENISFNTGNTFNKGAEALDFYLSFADPMKEIYTWNDEMPNSLDAFAQGKLAFYFGYSGDIQRIKAKSPNLNFIVIQAPQVDLSRPINYTNYWVQTVFNRSKYTKEAWDFLLFVSQKKNLKHYLDISQKPTVLRSLIDYQKKNPLLSPFASQVLTAKTWQGYYDFNYIDETFKKVFDDLKKEKEEKNKTLKEIFNNKKAKENSNEIKDF